MKVKILNSLTLLVLSALIWSCTPQQEGDSSSEASVGTDSHPMGQASVVDEVSDPNILQVAISSEPHSTLVAAVQAAQIEHVLVNAGPLTVFAPVNEAFDALPEGTLDNLLKPENKGDLATIITRHAAPGSFDIEALKREARKGRKIYMATGDYLEVIVDGDDVSVGGAKIVGTVAASNGIIHVIEKVILP
ncbi:fasciclin domain-containing protein [Ekhidna sp.]|uniref:fasciclin domain-containing protein n=1 Tax=Ekhidna sp. TaxID=2608089 RepID=UPI003B506357